MGPYHQVGHHAWNLVSDAACVDYAGAVLSPVNYDRDEIAEHMSDLPNDDFEMVFDPQLYFPTSERGRLPEWEYFPTDVDTADLSSMKWWDDLVEGIADEIAGLGVPTVCSPAYQPRSYPNEYYETTLAVAECLSARTEAEVLPTILLRMGDLASNTRVQEIASIVTGSPYRRAYLVFGCEEEPRREVREAQDLAGAMALIGALEAGGVNVLVGYCCSDVLLWRAAGASSCATGKFFNLRRFTASRFAPPSQGGGQIDYWFEEGLLGFLRQADIARARAAGVISDSSNRNPYSKPIADKIANGQAWRADSWRHYMWWFADAFARVSSGKQPVGEMLAVARENWATLRRLGSLDEVANDGRWIDPWIKAAATLR